MDELNRRRACAPQRTLVATALLVLAGCGGGGGGGGGAATVVPLAIDVDAALVTGALRPLWRDHYDLSSEQEGYFAEPGFAGLVDSLQPRSWRCSVGRWEIGFAPPAGGDSLDPAVLGAVEREFYRGGNTLAEADDPANYDFAYLDAQLAGLVARGATPFLCFDYMPLTLSSEQDPSNLHNFNLSNPGFPFSQYSFSNGIRTAPPADPAVYARVVRNSVRHVRGLFAGATDYGVEYVEVGNEPDLVDATGQPFPVFWTGTRTEFYATYAAVAAAVDADPLIAGLVQVGAGSFAFQPFEPAPPFAADFLAAVALAGGRLDFVSIHTYGDSEAEHFERFLSLAGVLGTLALAPELVNAEWGRALDGLDPVYDRIEHGLFRARVLALMQLFGFTRAHEALFRDPGPGTDQLGLVRTGPPAHKPVSDCYRALGLLDPATEALATSAPAGAYVLAGRDPAATRVVVAVAVDEPAPGEVTRIELAVGNPPWGAAAYELTRWRVTEESSNAGAGVEPIDVRTLAGDLIDTLDVGAAGAGLYVWELVRL